MNVEAQLFVADVTCACEFFTGKLGFAVAFVYGDPPVYGQVFRDDARLNLRMVCEDVFVAGFRRREGLLAATITVSTAKEIEGLYGSYEGAGVSFEQRLKTEPWGGEGFYRGGSGWEPDPVCRAGGRLSGM